MSEVMETKHERRQRVNGSSV